MTHKNNFRFANAVLLTIGILGLVGSAIAEPSTVLSQKKGSGGGGGGGSRSSGGGQQAHARREGVRTQTYVNRTQGGSYQKTPPVKQSVPSRTLPPAQRNNGSVSKGVQNQRTFTKTTAGRQYDNGLILRRGVKVTGGWQREYFPHGYVHFPFYHPTYIRGQCFISPFGFYFGICVPYIDISVCGVFPPSVVFIDTPVYQGNNCIGYADSDSQNLINDPNLDQNEPGLNNALDELAETFQGGNIDGLVSLINPNMKVAIFQRGKYQYSMQSNDFVDLTRDSIQSTQTIQFTMDYLHQRSPTVFSVSGRHVYQAKNGQTRTVYLSFVLQDIGGLWTLTQVGTSPDIIQKL